MSLNKVLLVLLTGFLTLSVPAQKFLEKSPENWSKDDALKLLNSSAWSQSYQASPGSAAANQLQVNREQNQNANNGGSNPRSYERNFGPAPVTIRLHSALPIRQAIVRLQQIATDYDKLDEKQRAEFDKSRQGFLTCAICQNFYVVTMTKFVDRKGQSTQEGLFERMTFEDLKGNVWLENDKGEKRELVQFNPPKGAEGMAVFYFARLDDNKKPFLTPESKKFEFVFRPDFLDSRNPYAPMLPRQFEFNISKLMINDKLVF